MQWRIAFFIRLPGTLVFLALTAVPAALSLGFSAPFPVVMVQKIAVPSYFYPGGYWTQLVNSAPRLKMAVISPDNGAGQYLDGNFSKVTEEARKNGITVIGYIYTKYGSRQATEIQAEMDRYTAWYGVDGFFLDEVSNECSQVPYYQGLHDYVKARPRGGKVVLNPGAATPECYLAAADVIVNFEGDYDAYLNWQPMGWESKYAADCFWHLVIGVSAANLPNALTLSKQRNAGWIYITDDTPPNPWDTLPQNPYWSDELNALSSGTRMFLPSVVKQ